MYIKLTAEKDTVAVKNITNMVNFQPLHIIKSDPSSTIVTIVTLTCGIFTCFSHSFATATVVCLLVQKF